jgi:8-oxo-dGTP diphosphatase
VRRGESLTEAAARVVKATLGSTPDWLEQVGAYTEGAGHPGMAAVSVCFVAARPWLDQVTWQNVDALRGMNERHRHLVSAAVRAVGLRLEHSPVAFSLLPPEFTLTELQQAYETLLRRRLHKASFRRSLDAASLVKPTGEWRVEGRGRPAQLFRYSPRRRSQERRGIRFDV